MLRSRHRPVRPRAGPRAISVDDDSVRLDASRHDPVIQRVTASIIRIGTDSISMRPVKLRYVWPSELDLMAQLAGLRLRHRWGSWDETDFTSGCDSHVSIYESAPGGPSAADPKHPTRR